MIVTLGSVTSNIVKEMLGCTTRFVNPKNKPQTKKKKLYLLKINKRVICAQAFGGGWIKLPWTTPTGMKESK